MASKTLTDAIIGCSHCHGEWLKANKVKKFLDEIKKEFDKNSDPLPNFDINNPRDEDCIVSLNLKYLKEIINKKAGEYFQ